MSRRTKEDWRALIQMAVNEARTFKKLVGSAPTLRALFYRLVSNETMANTRSEYTQLSKKLSIARKEGVFPWSLIKDETRKTMDNTYGDDLEDIKYHYENLLSNRTIKLRASMRGLDALPKQYSLNKWDGQPKQVVFLLEKEALADAVSSLTSGWGVNVNIMKGYSSTTNTKRLVEIVLNEPEKETVFLILSDFDPSGEDLARHIENEIINEFGVMASFEKIGVTLEQIKEYNLPSRPEDSSEQAKMKRDKRFNSWEHGFFRVELDALLSFVPDEFKKILDLSINQHYDNEIYETLLSERDSLIENTNDEITEFSKAFAPIKKQLTNLLGEFLDNLERMVGSP